MSDSYQNCTQSNGGNGDISDDTTSLNSFNSNPRSRNPLNFLRSKIRNKDENGNGRVHRIQGLPAEDQQEMLCSLRCCGLGRMIISWASRDVKVGGAEITAYSLRKSQSVESTRTITSTVTTANEQAPLSLTSNGVLPAVQDSQPLVDDPEQQGGEPLGRLQFSIAYDFPDMTLTLRIIRAADLAAKDFSGTSDPYVKIMLLPDKKRKLMTNVKRKTLNPRWNEVFAFEGFPYNKLLHRTLYIQVLDYDRFSRDDPIGEICIPISEFDLTEGQVLWKNLQPCKGHMGKLGELLVGLCYQPTTGKVTVSIDRARDIKAKDINGLSDPYVKIWLLQDGKKTEKKKTAVMEKTLNPVFNESFTFDVPYEKIRLSSLSISVMDYDRMGRNEEIGQIVLGTKSGTMESKHWNEMFSKTRQEVRQWHILKDFN